MDFKSFVALDRDEAFKEAAKIAGVEPGIFDGIWRTESARGQKMLSPAGAEGHFGLMPTTRKTMEGRFGSKIDPYDFNQSLFTAAHLMKENLGKFGNVPDALRAYNGGWNPKTWGNPETSAYAGKVLRDLGGDSNARPTVDEADEDDDTNDGDQAPAAYTPRTLSGFDVVNQNIPYVGKPQFPLGGAGSGKTPKPALNSYEKQSKWQNPDVPADTLAANMPAVVEQDAVRRTGIRIHAGDAEPAYRGADAVEARQQEEADALSRRTFIDLLSSRAAGMPVNAMGRLIGRNFANREEPVEPPTMDEIAGLADEDVPRVLVGNSRAMRQVYKEDLLAERKRDAEDAKMGGLPVFMADLVTQGADPVNMVAGYGFARAFAAKGYAAAQMASTSRGAIAGVAENVLGNVSVEGMEQYLKGYSEPTDLLAAAGVGAGLGAVGGGFVGHLSKRQRSMLDGQAADLIERMKKVREDLGPEATVENVQAETLARVERDIQARATLNEAPVPASRRMFTEDPTGEDAIKLHEDSSNLLPQRAHRSDVDNHGTIGEPTDVDKMDLPSLMSESELAALETLPTRNGFHDGGTGFGKSIEPRGTRVADSPEGFLASLRAAEARGVENQNGSHRRITERTGFDSYDSLMKMGQRVIASRMLDPGQVKTVDQVRRLIEKYMPEDHRIVFTSRMDAGNEFGWAHSVGKAHIIALRDTNTPAQSLNTAIHEIGHVVVNAHIGDAPVEVRNAIMKDWLDFLGKAEKNMPEAWHQRLSITSATGTPEQSVRAVRGSPISVKNEYAMKQDEYLAEQFVKHVQKMLAANKYGEGITADLKKAIMDMVHAALSFFRDMNRIKMAHGLMKADEGAHDFFQSIFEGKLRADVKAKREATAQRQAYEDYGLDRSAPLGGKEDPDAANKEAFRRDAEVRRFGLDTMPLDTPSQRAEAKAVLSLWERASDPNAAWNTMNPKHLDTLLERGGLKLGSAAINMLRSDSPIIRMVAAELVENPNGAAGRRSTAAISKFLNERKYLGSTIPQYDLAYQQWAKDNGGNLWSTNMGGELRARFDKEIALERENRRIGSASTADSRVVAAANLFDQAYDRMRVDQVAKQVRGYKALPTTSVGYMPHRVSPEKMQNLTIDQQRALIDVVRDQVMSFEGWDKPFSEEFARKYLDAARRKATGGYDTNFNLVQPGALDMVANVGQTMGMTPDEVKAMQRRFAQGRAGHTKTRTELDLTQEFTSQDGSTFTLLDVFDTDQLSLLRAQATRVAGEVALSDFGVAGKEGLDILRRAAEFGEVGQRPQGRELEFFDQVSAELLGQPFGEVKTKLADRTIMMTTLARLGGMGFQQIAETINGIATVGATATIRSLSSMGRLRAEAKALARGEQVNNPFLHSIEQFGGADFGADSYKLKFPFDNPTVEHQVYGRDTLGVSDRLMRGGIHAQAKLSFWRSIHAAQTRGFAEQIVLKSARYVAEGKNDTALRDIGLDDAWMAAARPHWGNVVQFDAHGNVSSFDISKLPEDLATTYTQSVWRGAAQIIQDTFAGERGAWAHGNWIRVLTQFRTFGLTSVEKQWGRQRNARGTAAALGILLGSMSLAAPIYTARVYAASLGRSDREQYVDKMLTPSRIARATLNMVSISGLAGDFIDATTAISGLGTTGGRTGSGKNFLGEIIAPGAGYVNDAFKAVQDTKKGTDITPFLKVLPFSNLPYLVPAVNALGK